MPITVDNNKQSLVRLPESCLPIAVLDTNTHTELQCVTIIQRDSQVIPESDPRHYTFDHIRIVRNMPQHCIDFQTVSGNVTLQLPKHARVVTSEDAHPYHLVYIENHSVTM